MTGSVIFDPLLEWSLVWAAVALAALFVAAAAWRGLSGWWLRGLAAVVLLAALFNPSFQQEDRTPLTDIVILVVDESASQRIADRPDQIAEALSEIEAEIATLPGTELRVVPLGDGEGDQGTLLMTALAEAMAEEPRARLAGALLLTDGQLHDIGVAPEMPAPLHVLLTGRAEDWDRRLIIKNAPAFAILGEPVTLTLRIEDQGAVPDEVATGTAVIQIAIDGGPAQSYRVPVGQDLDLPVTLPHGGMNVIQFTLPTLAGELTDRNNAAVVQINGVRDRLRVLLVSGEPHSGERTWRNLLKSDSAVDLVHFTILRPPEKQDGVPVNELSLIAFPTRELFIDKIDEFDLIIFDRYKRRGILPALYLDNVRQYVVDGGAVLVAAGPDFAQAASLFRSPLGDILPAEPTSIVIEEGFTPEVTELGHRHPVTEGLEAFAPVGEDGEPKWGRWFRIIDMVSVSGSTVMQGIDERPLLVLDRVGEGRIALLGSDHAWLWSRGYEGGGPQLELLRRLAHWMMKEPELEEEALIARAEGQSMTITRRTLGAATGDLELTAPDGTVSLVPLEETRPGRFEAVVEGPEIGLYRLREGDKETVIGLGPSAPREFETTIATGALLEPAVAATRGGVIRLADGTPDLRAVRAGRPAAGRGWLGITPREAYLTADVTVTPLVRAWLFLLLGALLIVGAWLREGRR
ncbi:Threonine dehydrogenase [Candidatus Rhodobacter oscarellae]|uniref:Threonine dehydrogenase n=1 Tax=Candidatus Rhodobacter oscarellae TaxID=1675527 RepID=A0A0J9E6C5_9RHOB|nr:membrane protein [Candidatus Rhodobacter lobularis]KMW58216.1 Threonine dehydrogenase [Candidatus Rhodobacter lobularis]